MKINVVVFGRPFGTLKSLVREIRGRLASQGRTARLEIFSFQDEKQAARCIFFWKEIHYLYVERGDLSQEAMFNGSAEIALALLEAKLDPLVAVQPGLEYISQGNFGTFGLNIRMVELPTGLVTNWPT